MNAARGLALTLTGIGLTVLVGCVGNSGSGTFSATAGDAGAEQVYTVMAGDTLWGISKDYGVPLQSLIDANTIAAPYKLQIGQQVHIPSAGPQASAVAANTAAPILGADYAVQPGDTLYAISRRSGIPVPTLAAANGLTAPYALQVGEQLTLPPGARDPELLAQAQAPIPTARAPLPEASATATAGAPLVAGSAPAGQPADLLGSLEGTPPAVSAGAPADLTQSGPQATSTALVEETTVVETVSADGETVALASAQAAVLQVPAGKPGRDVALPAIAAQPPPPPSDAALPSPPKRQGRLFDWPVTGKVISSHGPKKGGLHNDGINIAAPAGTPVRAAESGVVAYTGGDLKGFGKLVLIKHQDGYVTAYAHNSQILVQRGETVRRGDVIARVGETGNVDTPQLHFEIRKDAKPIDPSGLMVGIAG